MNDKGKDVNSDWLADQWDERGVLGHARVNKGRMKGDDPQIDTARNLKRLDWRLALQGKIQKTFADSIPNKRPIFQVEMFIYQSKANLDEKVFFSKITHHLDPEIRKLLVNGTVGTRIHIPFFSMVYVLSKLNFYF